MKKLSLLLPLFLIACSSKGHDHHMDHGNHAEHHSHGFIELDESLAPTIDISLEEDAMSGWNLHIATTNFQFAPENVNKEHKDGEGHAHVYVDGEKIARLYSPYMHIPALSKGKHKVSVSLNANDHADLHVNGEDISDFVWIIQE